MKKELPMKSTVFRQPSALVPIAMSVAALVMTLVAIAVLGAPDPAAPPHDEGALAHTWQLLMAGQLPVIAWFALKWLPRRPGQAIGVLALQLAAMGAAAFPVFWLGL
jgi:hypothetical protein